MNVDYFTMYFAERTSLNISIWYLIRTYGWSNGLQWKEKLGTDEDEGATSDNPVSKVNCRREGYRQEIVGQKNPLMTNVHALEWTIDPSEGR